MNKPGLQFVLPTPALLVAIRIIDSAPLGPGECILIMQRELCHVRFQNRVLSPLLGKLTKVTFCSLAASSWEWAASSLI